MKTVRLQLMLRSPALLAGSPSASGLLETLPFIPGNAVRGVLARHYLEVRQKADAVFHQLFVSGKARFGFAFALGSQVIPLSARSCKYDGGFRKDGEHGMVDLLLRGDDFVSCIDPQCGGAIDGCRGFWDPLNHRRVEIRTRLITRSATDAARGSASTGGLYLQRVLAEDQKFGCTIEVPDNLESYLFHLVDEPFSTSLGKGASRGQGSVDVERKDFPLPEWGLAKDRFALFSGKSGKPVLALTLLTDGIFRDDYLRDAMAPALEDLVPLHINPSDWKPAFTTAFADTRTVFGFDGEPMFLPRVPRVAVSAGSAFLFEAKDEVAEPVVPDGEGVGWIGGMNREGYGLAALWHPFHAMPEGREP